MRWVALALLLLATALAGCAAPGSTLRPPCTDSDPVRIDIVADKERYRPGEVMNVSLVLENAGDAAALLRWRSWELTMKAFDGLAIRSFVRDENPEGGGVSTSVPAEGRVTLQETWQPFRVTAQLFQPLQPGTYYLCAVLTGADGAPIATGARPFISERPAAPF